MARVGIYGGSYNPPHIGHCLAAAEMVRHLELDRLIIMPAATPPHKSLAAGSPTAEERLDLCRLSFASIPQARVSDLELRRQGPSYTVDTLRELRELYPEDELFLIMGTDMLLSFDQWRCPEEIAAMATLAVMHREDDEALWEQVRIKAEALSKVMKARIVLVQNRCVEISSTTVRRLLAMGAPGYLEPSAEKLIRSKGWYLYGADLKNLPFDELKESSLSLHDEKRRAHVVGCSETAQALAEHYGADPDLAARAGILHDITKALGPTEQLHLCEKYGIVLTELQRANPKLLHAKTGAVIAREIFGESDEVCEAIRWHTTGKPQMTLLEKIIYLADYIEPNRDFPGVEALRQAVWEELDKGLYQGLDLSIRILRKQGRIIDPDSLQAWEYYKKYTERSNQL